MDTGELTCTVELRRRSLTQRIVRSPFLWFRHYREIRRSNGVLVSAVAAWMLARGVLITK